MAKQFIYIGTRAGNDRIERAIPKLQKKEGWKKNQATAVAIRLESVGRLGDYGGVRKKPVNPSMIAAAAMMKSRTPKQTRQKTINNVDAQSIGEYKRKVQSISSKKPKK